MDKGKIKSQCFVDRESRLIQLYREAFGRQELNSKETVTALRQVGFSEIMAVSKASGWAEENRSYAPEAATIAKKRKKEQQALEAWYLKKRFAKKNKKKKD
ncbi:MAG: hypothetical protein LBH44_09915 [Treponema sp.]|jgi:hypothetical protein|nr:hypothetical protein [Treponema sp.]